MQVDEQKFGTRKGIKPSKYRDIGWSREMGQPLMQSIRPTSYIDEFRHPENAGKNDWSNLVHVNGYIKVNKMLGSEELLMRFYVTCG